MEYITPLDSWIAGLIGADGRLTREAIEKWQLAKLSDIVSFAYKNSQFYRELFGESSPRVETFDDFKDLPFVVESDLRLNSEKMAAVRPDEISRIVTLQTSGTGGLPKRIFNTESDLENTIEFFANGLTVLVHPGDIVGVCMPCQTYGGVGDLIIKGLERLGATGIGIGPVFEATSVLGYLEKYRINVLIGLPVHMRNLALTWNRNGQQQDIKIERVLLSADVLCETIREQLTGVWRCAVYEHYGLTEAGYGGAVDCLFHAGMHIREADLYAEIVHPVTGKPVPDGQQGEVVITTLTRLGMPMIRYRTGDISAIEPGICPCGSPLRRLKQIRMRKHLAMNIDGETICQADFDDIMFKFIGLKEYSVEIIPTDGVCNVMLLGDLYPQTSLSNSEVTSAFWNDRRFGQLLSTGRMSLRYEKASMEVQVTDGMNKRKLKIPGVEK